MPKQEKVRVNVKERVEDDTIDLSLSELTEVPVRDIASFRRVTFVDLSNNKIIYLGKNFPSLTHLFKLDLSNNQIRTLPEDFGNLRSLRHLDLYNNRIERLPLSFGNLHNLRFLDLKANPLVPALSKIVGQCLTTKDCNESARNTVKFLCQMQKEVQKIKEESDAQIEVIEDVKKPEIQKPKKKKNKKKSKNQKPESPSMKSMNNKSTNSKRKSCDSAVYNDSDPKLNTVLKTLFVFVFLLAINIIMFYIITVKNPEIAERLVGFIPPYYRELILTKTEDMKLNFLRLSDLLQKFRTPPT